MSKTAVTGSLIGFQLEDGSALPKYQQIADHLRCAIESGRIPAGIKLPSTRVFAEEIGLSRNLILQSFDRLIDEGFLSSRIGDGTYVLEPTGGPGRAPLVTKTSFVGQRYPVRALART